MKKKVSYFMLGLVFLLSTGTPVYAETVKEYASCPTGYPVYKDNYNAMCYIYGYDY